MPIFCQNAHLYASRTPTTEGFPLFLVTILQDVGIADECEQGVEELEVKQNCI